MALGLLVDAAIVMTDEIGKRLAAGMKRIDAVADAVRRLFMPLFASTVTTILSFLPLLLLPGPAGDFVGSIAIAVVVMLVWSFVIAVTITPAVSGWWLGEGDGTPAREGLLMRAFRLTLRAALAHPVKALAITLVPPLMGFMALPTLTPQFFPGTDRDQFTIELDMPEGTALAETRRVAEAIDARLRAEDDILGVAWVFGRSAPAFYYNLVGNRDQAPAFAQALVRTASPAATARLLVDLQAALPPAFPEARVLIRGLVQGPPVDAPVELRLVGSDIATLRAAGDQLRAVDRRRSREVTVARTTVDGGAPKLTVDVDEARARLLGLDLAQVARQMEAGLEGVTGGSLLEGTEELPVRVRLGAGLRADPVALADMPILPPGAAAAAAAGQLPRRAALHPRHAPARTVGEHDHPPERRTGEHRSGVPDARRPPRRRAPRRAGGGGGERPYPPRRRPHGNRRRRRRAELGRATRSSRRSGLIITLSIAIVVLTFNSFRLSPSPSPWRACRPGSSLLPLAAFNYPSGSWRSSA